MPTPDEPADKTAKLPLFYKRHEMKITRAEVVIIFLALIRTIKTASGDAGQAVRVALAAARPSSPIDVSRILNFCTFPVTVIGKSPVNRTYFGTL
jgi:hypothetical protein